MQMIPEDLKDLAHVVLFLLNFAFSQLNLAWDFLPELVPVPSGNADPFDVPAFRPFQIVLEPFSRVLAIRVV
jgi:hypothetical protein